MSLSRVNSLSQETIEELCSTLEKVPTLNFEVLMKSRSFRLIYKEDVAALIPDSNVLLKDMALRDVKVQHLLNGLEEIGHKKAVSIIMKEAQKLGLNVQDSCGRPPPGHSIDRSQEHEETESYSTFSCEQSREQVETLKSPIQEEGREDSGHTFDSGFGLSPLNVASYLIASIFRCFSA